MYMYICICICIYAYAYVAYIETPAVNVSCQHWRLVGGLRQLVQFTAAGGLRILIRHLPVPDPIVHSYLLMCSWKFCHFIRCIYCWTLLLKFDICCCVVYHFKQKQPQFSHDGTKFS